LRAFEECKSADIKAHREAYAKLLTRIENLRKEYAAQLKNGKITKAQFEAKMKELRSDFETSLKVIKASYAKRLNACYEKYMRALKEILTERQWKAFVDCYR
jgi:molecular chaperone GrpE (heat shock protein)